MPITGSDKALMYCQSGVERCGATRSGYHSNLAYVSVAGTDRTANIRRDNEPPAIEQALDHEPDTAQLRVWNFTPTEGQEVIVTLGSKNSPERLFAGRILAVTKLTELDNLSHVGYALGLIDYTWDLKKRKVNKQYGQQSATPIVLDLMATFSSGFTINRVQASLPTVTDGITFTNEDLDDALSRIAERIGGYWFIDYQKDLNFFTSQSLPNPATLDATNPWAHDFQHLTDLSQVRTRVFMEGGGSVAAANVLVGSTKLPVEDGSWYSASGGKVAVGPQRPSYTGKTTLSGALVGLGSQPTTAPSGAIAGGTNLTAGATYKYAVTFVTASGETLPGPELTFVAGSGTFAAPANAPTAVNSGTGGGKLVNGGSYKWKYTYTVDGGGETTPSPESSALIANTNRPTVDLTTGGPTQEGGFTNGQQILQVVTYRTTNGGSIFYQDNPTDFAGVIEDVFGDLFNDTDLVNQPQAPSSNTANLLGCGLTNIPIGPTGTTQRKIYRTVAGGSQLKLQSTIANNTATTLRDNTADGSLGANAPTSDTSGLVSSGQVNAGSTTLRLTNTDAFQSGGGWVQCGTQIITYTGKTTTDLTGIPSSGDGAIVVTIAYNTEAIALVHLTGIPASGTGSVEVAIEQSEPVNVVAEKNDAGAQTALAALIGGDGIIEEYAQDNRLSLVEAEARAQALLDLYKDPEVIVSFNTRDPLATVGRTITVSYGSPVSVSGTFRIQRVAISEIGHVVNLSPLRHVEASSRLFSFEDLVRRIRQRERAA